MYLESEHTMLGGGDAAKNPDSTPVSREQSPENLRVAVKDTRLVYRACSSQFASAFGRHSPDEIIGRCDFDFLPASAAREQAERDGYSIMHRETVLSVLTLNNSVSIRVLRTPIVTRSGKVTGLDIQLLGDQTELAAFADACEKEFSSRVPRVARRRQERKREHAANPLTRQATQQARQDEVQPDAQPVVRSVRSQDTINYRLLVDTGLQGSLVLRNDEVLFANPQVLKQFGYESAEQLIEKRKASSLFPKEDWSRIRRNAQPPNEPVDSKPLQFPVRAFSATGKAVHLLAQSQEIFWQRDPALLISLVSVDPSQHNIESINTQALQQSEQRFRHYAKASADFFWELDDQLRFSFVSDELAAILDLDTPDALIGKSHEDLLVANGSPIDSEIWDAQFDRLRNHQPFRDFEFSWKSDGETKSIRYSGIPVYDSSHQFMGYRGAGRDVTAAHRLAESVAYQANHDALTGLVNRRQFELLCNRALEKSKTERAEHALCFLDLDNFKIVNDTCGHVAGDELLRQLSSLLDNLVRKSDVLARLGGDEFAVFLYNCSVAEALKLANQIRSEIENFNFLWEGNRFQIGVSIGLVVVDDRWNDLDALLRAADSACYLAKNEGRNRVTVYREGDGHASNRKVETHWVKEITAALEEDRIVLATQRILPATHDKASDIRIEVLARLMREDGTVVNPRAFLPSAERYGLSQQLDKRVLDLTLQWISDNPALLQELKLCSLNLSSTSFADSAFTQVLIDAIRQSRVPFGKLCFELTETSTIANLSAASEFIRRMSRKGCQIMLDDFGSGLSSFAYLKDLPVDYLKIDGLIVKDILDDPIDFTMVKAINEISQSIGHKTIAKHVETPELQEAVRAIGVDYMQGYHLGRPEIVSF